MNISELERFINESKSIIQSCYFKYRGFDLSFSAKTKKELYCDIIDWLYNNGYKFENKSIHRKLLTRDDVEKWIEKSAPYLKNNISRRDIFHNVEGTDKYVITNFIKQYQDLIFMLNDFGATDINFINESKKIDDLDIDNENFDSDKLELENPIKKMNFIKAAQLCLKNNNNQPMSVNDIWNNIKDYVDYKTETPLNSLATILGFFSENSNRTHKAKNPIFKIVSENPIKYVLIDPNNIQETEDDDSNKTGYESETPEIGTEAQYLSFWSEFTRRLSQFTKRFDGRRRNRKRWLSTPTDVKSISYVCVIRRDRADLEVYFNSKSPIYYKLLKLRSQIEKEFGNSLEWIDNQQKKCCKIIFVKIFGQSFPKNREEVMNFFLENFPKFENVFNKYLKNTDNTPEDPTDTKISKFSDWTSSYPNVSPQYKYPNPTTKITSEPQKFTSYLTPIDKFLDPNRPLDKPTNTDKTNDNTQRLEHPFKQSICVLGEPGAGKSTTVAKLLEKAGHEFEIWEPTATSGMLSEFSPDKSDYVPSRLGKMLIKAQQTPDKIFTFVIDEAHKRETIRKIDDTLKGAISTRRWHGKRFIPQELQTEYLSKFLEVDKNGNFKIPDNFSFMFISSKPDVMKSNMDIFERLDFVVLRNWQTENINTIDDLKSRILTQNQKNEL